MQRDFVAIALNLPEPTVGPSLFSGWTTDSRKIHPGCLFIAIPGEKFDGHDFIEAALRQGAGGILARTGTREKFPSSSTAFFEVPDTLEAFRKLGQEWRNRYQGPVILIAGSVGKTTTKEIFSALLRGKFQEVLRTSGSQNGFVGIPMTLLEIDPTLHSAAVVEVGIDEIGAMAQHLDLVRADAGILTPIAPEHLEKLIDLPTVAREETLALQEIDSRQGITAVSLDDPWLQPLCQETPKGQRVYFSLQGAPAPKGRDAQVLRGKLDSTATKLSLQGLGLDGTELPLPLPGDHNALNLLGACAMARALGLDSAQLRAGLATFSGAAGRSEIRQSQRGNTVICDYYNASPASVAAGLALLERTALAREAQGASRKLAVLGDMLELGPQELSFHRDLAAHLARHGVARVFLYGPRMRALHETLQTQHQTIQSSHFDTHEDLARALLGELLPTDTLLIKGSRGMRMEEIWKRVESA
jgi:UDP-N-acetylmuramoyl-tripeptide--D-alanyl-D-alanine ligase